MAIQAKKAVKYQVKVKIALIGPSGSGKTYSALRLATGMGSKILLGNTESDRGYLYASMFDYDIADLTAPYTPEKYIELIDYAEKQGYDTLIIDSGTHEWSGRGGLLEAHDSMPGNSYANWAKITPRHNTFVDRILYAKINIIVCLRGKDVYVMTENERGKQAPKKEGLGADMRANFEYEMMATLMIDQQTHVATAMKDNTKLFENRFEVLTEEHGKMLMQWANNGVASAQPNWAQMQYQYQPQQPIQPMEQQQAGYGYVQSQQPVQQAPVQPVNPVYGFLYHEQEIIQYMTATWGNLQGFDIPGYIQQRYQRPPAQLTAEECYALMMEFSSYAQQKQGGQQ